MLGRFVFVTCECEHELCLRVCACMCVSAYSLNFSVLRCAVEARSVPFCSSMGLNARAGGGTLTCTLPIRLLRCATTTNAMLSHPISVSPHKHDGDAAQGAPGNAPTQSVRPPDPGDAVLVHLCVRISDAKVAVAFNFLAHKGI